jgi:hypothetical protein
MDDYEKYQKRLRQNPEAIVLVRSNGHLVTFGNDAVLVAGRLSKQLTRVNRHRTVMIGRGDLAQLTEISPEPLEFA